MEKRFLRNSCYLICTKITEQDAFPTHFKINRTFNLKEFRKKSWLFLTYDCVFNILMKNKNDDIHKYRYTRKSEQKNKNTGKCEKIKVAKNPPKSCPTARHVLYLILLHIDENVKYKFQPSISYRNRENQVSPKRFTRTFQIIENIS